MKTRFLVFWLVWLLVGKLEGAKPLVLVPANVQPQTDKQGFIWDIDSNGGYINNGSNCFSNTHSLEINGSGFSAQQPQMSADGSELFLSGQIGNVEVKRRIRVDHKGAYVRYFETVRNIGSGPENVRLGIRLQFNNQMQAVVGDSGQVVTTALGPKDIGVLVVPRSGQTTPGALWLLAARNAKVRPMLQNQSNSRLHAIYNLQLAAGESVSIVHALAQRNLAVVPDAKSLAKLFAPLNSPQLLGEVSPAERKTLVNFSPGGFSLGVTAPTLVSFLDQLGVERGSTDILAIGASTRLKGTASCAQLEIETRRGKTTVGFEQVAAIQGGRREARVLLRDGQALRGKLMVKALKFVLTTGTTIQLNAETLDRLVLRALPGEGQLAAAGWGFVDTFDGDRLALKADPGLKLRATTVWGVREIPAEELVGCGPTEENPLGFRVLLKDGSSFVSLLDGEELALETVLFGRKKFGTAEIRQIAVNQPKATEESAPVQAARVTVVGEQVIAGQIDLAELHFLSSVGVIPVVTNLIRTLQLTSDDERESAPSFTAVLWGGSTVTGVLREVVLPVRSGSGVFQVPVHDLKEAVVPSPAMPEGLRDKIAGLIRDLAHPDWEKREAASRELAELGAFTRRQLEEALKLTTDAEVRRRAQALIDGMETF